ncbi:MAG: PAC2 family protein [Sulfolobales archaeon]|nr:PAC2 family protein [Sulfolobales archaeon]
MGVSLRFLNYILCDVLGDTLFKVKQIREFIPRGRTLIVGLPGMGGVAYTVANHVIASTQSKLVAEFYMYSYPPQVNISNGLANLFKATLHDTPLGLVLTANAQPATPEAQNEFCDHILEYLHRNGLDKVIATAAYVVANVSGRRNIYVTGNNEKLINEFLKYDAQLLQSGVVSGVNGAIVGWASYYDIPAVVLLSETWEPIVQVDEFDYRAAKHLLLLLGKYLNYDVNTEVFDSMADQVEGKVAEMISRSLKQFEVRKVSKDIM